MKTFNPKKSISSRFMFYMIIIVLCLTLSITSVTYILFINYYESQIYKETENTSGFIYNNVSTFIDGAYNISAELVNNPEILSMETEKQSPLLASCVERNDYLELIYIQDTDGMQTGRSSGELADRSERWWFKEIMSAPRSFISNSYYSVATNMPCTSVFMPLYRDGSLIGIIGVDIKLEYIQKLIENFADHENGKYSFIIDGNGAVVAHPESQYIEQVQNFKTLTMQLPKTDGYGKTLVDDKGDVITEEQHFEISDEYKKIIENVMNGKTGGSKITIDNENYYVSYAPIPLKGVSDSWSVITLQEEKAAMAVANKIIISIIIISSAILIAAVFIISVFTRRITKPLKSMTYIAHEMSNGSLNVKIDCNSNDETGILSDSLSMFIENLRKVINDINYVLKEIAEKNMTAIPKIEYKGDFESISDSLSNISKSLNKTLNQINITADTVSNGSSNVYKAAESLSRGALEQTKAISNLSESISGISEKIHHMADNTYEAGVKANEVYNEIILCGEQMQNVKNAMNSITESSEEIKKIIGTINEISSQTNILAINASVEASRAYKAGAGNSFSVLAGEIKTLSERSSEATDATEELVKNSVKAVEYSMNIINNAEETLLNVLKSSKNVSAVVKEISNASSEQVNLVEEITYSIGKISGVVHANSAAAIESSEASKDLSKQAHTLKTLVKSFKLK